MYELVYCFWFIVVARAATDWRLNNVYKALSLNVLKPKCLFTGTRQKISLLPSDPHISLDGHSIERVNSYKCLGVQVDETLSWEAHISEVIGKVAKVLAALRRLRPICPQSTLVTIYKSLILPHLDYCSAVWGCIGNGLSQKLEKLQNRAARIITGSSWDASSAPILHALKWDSLAERRVKQLCICVNKSTDLHY